MVKRRFQKCHLYNETKFEKYCFAVDVLGGGVRSVSGGGVVTKSAALRSAQSERVFVFVGVLCQSLFW